MNRTALKSKLSIIDGGNGTEIEKLLPKQVLEEMSSEWIALTSITHPEIVKKVHADFVKAGANFIIANTYNGQLAHICGKLLHGGLGRNSKF